LGHIDQPEDPVSKRDRAEKCIAKALEYQANGGIAGLPAIWTDYEFEIPKSILQLTSLQRLEIWNCAASNIEILCQLPNLQTLELGGYDIALPSLTFLQNLKQLKRLTLRSNRNFDASCLKGMTQLEALTLQAGQGGRPQINVGDLAALADMPFLKTFILNNAAATDFGALANCRALSFCSLGLSNVEDLSWAKNLHALKYLHIGETPLSDISALADLKALEQLYVYKTHVEDISALSKIPNLREVNLSDTPLQNVAPLGDCTALERVDISNTTVTSLAGLALPQQSFALGKKLIVGLGKKINSATANLNVKMPNSWVKKLAPRRRLYSLNCANTSITDISPLKNELTIGTLNLSGTAVTDISVLWSGLNVSGLHISNTQISDLGPKGGLSHLRSLYAENTLITNLEALTGANLRALNVNHTAIRDLSPLQESTSLVELHVRATDVEDLQILKWAASGQIDERTDVALDYRETPVSSKSAMMRELAQRQQRNCFLDTKFFLTGTFPKSNFGKPNKDEKFVIERESAISKGADPNYVLRPTAKGH
jgi:hypothetical protein